MTRQEIFTRNLNHHLEARNELQKDLAKALHVTGPAVSQWISGVRMPRIDTIQAIADHFGIELIELIGDGITDEDAATMAKFFDALSEEGKQRVLSYASYLLGEERRPK